MSFLSGGIEKVGTASDVWVTCPKCSRVYYVAREFWDPMFAQLRLHCPFCQAWFDKTESKQTLGL